MSNDRCDLLCLDLEKAERLRLQRLDGEQAVRLAANARALADPTRLTIAAALAATDELCVCDLAWVTERAENLVSHTREHCVPSASPPVAGTEKWSSIVSPTPAGLCSTPSSPVRERSHEHL